MTYTLTGPNNYSHTGTIPDKLAALPVGAYQVSATLGDWKLPAETFTIHPDENVQQVIKPPYATVALQSDPPGATVRNGNKILGQTPFTLSNQRPGVLELSFDLPPYTIQRLDLNLTDSDSATKSVTLTKDKDFVAACGLPMVWIPGGNFWAAKYLMPQSEFEAVGKYNPSFFRRADRPVENISWDNANAFCQKLTEYESKAGKLPAGYKYSLPERNPVVDVLRGCRYQPGRDVSHRYAFIDTGRRLLRAEQIRSLRHARQRLGVVPRRGRPGQSQPARWKLAELGR